MGLAGHKPLQGTCAANEGLAETPSRRSAPILFSLCCLCASRGPAYIVPPPRRTTHGEKPPVRALTPLVSTAASLLQLFRKYIAFVPRVGMLDRWQSPFGMHIATSRQEQVGGKHTQFCSGSTQDSHRFALPTKMRTAMGKSLTVKPNQESDAASQSPRQAAASRQVIPGTISLL